MMDFLIKLKDDFVRIFLTDNRWEWLLEGLKNTLLVTFFSLLLGLAIGVVIAIIRSTFDKNREEYRKKAGFSMLFGG